MKADKLELWIASITTWNFMIVQRNRSMLNCLKLTLLNCYIPKRTPSIKRRLIEVSLYLFLAPC